MGSISLTVPAVPAVAGLSLWAQALIVPFSSPALLTNATMDGILR